MIPRKALTLSGEENLARYDATKNACKHYCKKCGTPLFNFNSRYPGACMLYLGSIEQCDTHIPSVNIYCENMLGWVEQIASIEKLEKGIDGT